MNYDLFKDKLLEARLNKERFISLTNTSEATYKN